MTVDECWTDFFSGEDIIKIFLAQNLGGDDRQGLFLNFDRLLLHLLIALVN